VREIVEWSGGASSRPTPTKSRNANESAARHAMPSSESDAGSQAGPTHRCCIKGGALGFGEIIESLLGQQLIQAPVKG
jgi:hypothetical protein